jgi:RsiW-degrading membrane proteinase PrsW (M82 family)
MGLLVGLVLGLIFVTPLVITYALFIKWCDRFEPEPWWLLIGAFLWGAIFATIGGGTLSAIGEAVIRSVTGIEGKQLESIGATVLAPICEEGAKGFGVAIIAFLSAVWLKELDGPLDGAIYGGIIGLGFTLTEDILYVGTQFAQSGIGGFVGLFFLRTVLLGLSHCTFTAMTGLGFGIAAESKSWFIKIGAPLVGYFCAMCLHALHNALPAFFGGEGLVLMLLISWMIDVLFFILLALLVVRDRSIVMRELAGEVGGLLHPMELALVGSYVTLGFRNWGVLLSRGWRPFQQRRDKQLALVELAFIKSRRRRGETGRDLDMKEMKLRNDVLMLNRQGIWIGS